MILKCGISDLRLRPLTIFRLTSGLPKIVSYFSIVIQIYNIWYTFRKPLGFALIICKKKFKICKISNILLQFQVIKQNMCKNKKCAKYDFWKAITTANSNVQKDFQNLQKLNFYLRKTENVKIFSWDIYATNYAKFLRKNFPIWFLLLKAFYRANIKSQNSMTGSRSNYRFSRVKVE